MNLKNKILDFNNNKIEWGMHTIRQIEKLVECLLKTIDSALDGDIVEFGCYVGESSKYLMKTLLETNSNKKLYVYDSFEGLPDLSKWEENSGWRPRTLKTTEDILIQNFEQNSLPIPIIHKDWFKDIPDDKIPEKICFAFLDGDFYESIYDSLNKIYDRVVDGGVILFHDYLRSDLPGVDAAIRDFLAERKIEYNVIEIYNQLGYMRKGSTIEIEIKKIKKIENNLTLVTGLWDIKREGLTEGWSRSYEDHYLKKFEQLLKIEANLIVFGDKDLESFVFERRDSSNTQFIHRDLDWFQNEFYPKIQEIRTSENWLSQAGWLRESTQARLEGYNPLVMGKMFLLNDARIMDKFSSRYMFWIDAGLTNTVHSGYFTHDKVHNNLQKWIKKFSFVCFPYEANTEIHGFSYPKINEYAQDDVKLVARGGFFGGPKHTISQMNNLYYDLMRTTLGDGYMGTEESLFSILLHRNKELINYFEIEGNGLMGKFFEDLKNDTLEIKTKGSSPNNMTDINKTSLYVIGFNSPNQLRTLIQSMIDYDRNYIDQPKKYLLNNSTDRSTDGEYQDLCVEWGFEIIGTGENLGICGGRQYIAEHFEKTDQDFMLFFEDDMFFYPKVGEFCRNGFGRKVDDLYWKSLEIISNSGYDFLKLNFSEFFGDNSTQWSWYNVPQDFRNSRWPLNPRLPKMGLDPNAPLTEFKNIRSHKGLAWVDGEIYYSNWPQIVSKEGNRKMFLETKWTHPFEQTWMSYIYQETMKEFIKPALLLLTPTDHNRFDHYSKELRKES